MSQSVECYQQCDTEAKKKKQSGPTWNQVRESLRVVCQMEFLHSDEKREETAIHVPLFKCQQSSSLGTGAEEGLFSVASVWEWLLVSFDLISILTWGYSLIFGADTHQGTHTPPASSCSKSFSLSQKTGVLFMRSAGVHVAAISHHTFSSYSVLA